jgi:PA-IL-like protein
MLFKSKFLRFSLALTLVFSLSILTFADTIRLKDGSIIKGKIVKFGGGQFTIVFGDGARQRQMNYFADEIDAIEFDSSPMPANQTISKINPPLPSPTPTPINNTTPNTKINDGKGNPNPPVNQPKKNDISNPKPIQINTKVLADNTSNGWTNTGWVVKKGQKIRISGTGRVSLGNGRYSTPSGVSSLPDNEKLMKNKPTGGLIAVIGDDNNDFIFIGASVEFIATRDGAMFLGVNEGILDDNSGSFDVTIEIDPGNGE